MKSGDKCHHWRYGPVKVISIDGDYVELEIMEKDGIVVVHNDPWNDVIDKQTTKKFHTKSATVWLHKTVKGMKSSPAPLNMDAERYKIQLHKHYR